MRIGKVAEAYHISVDNLYYYIKYGLLVPPRPKGQYVFDEKTLKDLALILELKTMDFSLPEIHHILSLYRISGVQNPEDIQELKSIYQKKIELCKKEKLRQNVIIQKSKDKIQDLTQDGRSYKSKGLPLSMLHLLCCPKCGYDLNISSANMSQQSIYSANLSCSCGYQAEIEEGILLTPNKNTSLYDKPDVHRELYKDLPPSLISRFQSSYNWMVEKLEQMSLENKVIMETYVNAWFFMHNHLDALDPKGKYIVVDKYPETLLMYKNLIERQTDQLDILYLADSSTDFPLKKESIDLHIDFFAVNEHNFYQPSFLLKELLPFCKKDASFLGTFFYFEQAEKSMKNYLKSYPESSNKNFNLPHFRESLVDNSIFLVDNYQDSPITDTGTNLGLGFHEKGEKLYFMPYLAKRITND